MTVDLAIRIAAGIGALVLAASAVAPAMLRISQRRSPASSKEGGVLVLATAPTAADQSSKDAHLVLDVAERLRAGGNVEGAKLAHQLIDLILETPCQAKR